MPGRGRRAARVTPRSLSPADPCELKTYILENSPISVYGSFAHDGPTWKRPMRAWVAAPRISARPPRDGTWPGVTRCDLK